MNHKNLERLMKLARRTGDALIVTDPEGNEPIVLMDIDRYESLLTQEINFAEEEPEVEDLPTITEEDFAPTAQAYEPMAREERNPPRAPKKSGDAMASAMQAETPATEKKEPSPEANQAPEQASDEDFGEEQFYLEPIE